MTAVSGNRSYVGLGPMTFALGALLVGESCKILERGVVNIMTEIKFLPVLGG